MSKLHDINSQEELERLIERYFDGETTLDEEAALRQALANCPWTSSVIDDAKMVMGYFAAHSKHQRRASSRTARRQHIGIAASIAFMLAIGGIVLWSQQRQQADQCIAYVNGKAISNDDAVIALINNDLDRIGDASQGMAAQLSGLGEALELDNE